MDAMTRKYNRMVVEAGLRKRAEARKEAYHEELSEKLIKVVNDNSYIACVDERYRKRLAEDEALRTQRAEQRAKQRAKRKALARKGTALLCGTWLMVALVAASYLLFDFHAVSFGAALVLSNLGIAGFAAHIYMLCCNAGKIAELEWKEAKHE